MEVDGLPPGLARDGSKDGFGSRGANEAEDDVMEAVSSSSSDTSDPDWGVNWGGTINSSNRQVRLSVSGLRASSRVEEFPSLEPQSLHSSRPAPPRSHDPGMGSRHVPVPGGVKMRKPAPYHVSSLQPIPSSSAGGSSSGGTPPGTPPWPGGGSASSNLAVSAASAGVSPFSDFHHLSREISGSGQLQGAPSASSLLWCSLHLSVTAGPSLGNAFSSGECGAGPPPKVSVGRHPDNTLVLADDEVSSYHAELRWDGFLGTWSLRDRGSLNGTCLNGRMVSEANRSRGQKHPLSAGDVIRLGTCSELLVTVGSPIQQRPPQQPPLRSVSSSSLPPPHWQKAVSQPLAGAADLSAAWAAAMGGGGMEGGVKSGLGLPAALGQRHSLDGAPPGFLFGKSPTAKDVCASPPRPIRTRSMQQEAMRQQEQASGLSSGKDGEAGGGGGGAAPLSSPVAMPEERHLEYSPLGISVSLKALVGRHHRLKGQASEDKAGWEAPLAVPGLPPGSLALFGVYDGHGGIRAAEEVSRLLPAEIASHLAGAASSGGRLSGVPPPSSSPCSCPPSPPSTNGSSPPPPPPPLGKGCAATQKALTNAYLSLDASLGCDEGCTATCLLVWREEEGEEAVPGPSGGRGRGGLFLQSANVGDSAALLIPLTNPRIFSERPKRSEAGNEGRQQQQHKEGEGGEADSQAWVQAFAAAAAASSQESCGGEDTACPWVSLTTDHRLVNPAEQARLEAIGVHVSKNGRLYGLNLGRSLGDKCLKDADLGLLATPSVSPLVWVPPGCAALVIIASDGLWDSISPAGAVDVALRAARKEAGSTPYGQQGRSSSPSQSSASSSAGPLVSRVTSALLEMADRHKRTDDITIMAIAVDTTR